MTTIGINALHLNWGVNAGTETYFTNIVKWWYEQDRGDQQFIMYCSGLPPWWEGEKEWFKVEVHHNSQGLVGRMLIGQIMLPLMSFKRLDVLFSPGYIGSLLTRTKQVVTIHDGFAWRFPKEIGFMRSIYWKTFIPRTAYVADKVISVSESTAADIERYCGIEREKIEVIPEGGAHLTNLEPDDKILQKLEVAGMGYFLCVGFFKEIKNPHRILDAYRQYRELVSGTDVAKLVLLGHVGGKQAQAILEEVSAIPGTIVGGRVSDEELVALYRNSFGLIFPSLFEGFGIPILEAQELGCPVVTSDISSMPEVAGKGAILVDPFDSSAICRAMIHLGKPEVRCSLAIRGNENVKKYSWKSASDQTLKLIRQVASTT